MASSWSTPCCYIRGVDRRKAAVWAVTGLVMAVAALAASSGPVRIWVNPAPTEGRSVVPSGPIEQSTWQPPADRGGDGWPWLGDVFDVVGIVLLVVFVAAFVRLAMLPRLSWIRIRLGGGRRFNLGRFEALPEVPNRQLDLDLDAARQALSGGAPRNAIVACWMQLEHDVGEAGWPRLMAETSAEYVERVVASSSIDPRPDR